MSLRTNEFNQPIGEAVEHWVGAKAAERITLQGAYCQIVPLDNAHAQDLYQAFTAGQDNSLWTYLPFGPFDNEPQFVELISHLVQSEDPLFHSIIDKRTAKPVGLAGYLRMKPDNGAIEIGGIIFSAQLQKTPAATEAMFLLMRHAFNKLGYRRYEWKCDSLNVPSRKAAERLGFSYEGLFKQALVYKGRNRDTAWYSIVDKDWPRLERGFEQWLDSSNFDATGQQLSSLSQYF